MEQAIQPVIPNSSEGQATQYATAPASTPWAYPASTASAALAPQPSACLRCGIPAPFGASFCANCGTPLTAPAHPTQPLPYPGGPYAPAPGQLPYGHGYPNAGAYLMGVPAAGWQAQAPPNGMTIAWPSAPGGTLAVPQAGFWLRVAAWLLDLFALTVMIYIVAVIGMIALGTSGTAGGYPRAEANNTLLVQVALLAVPWLYYTVAESSRHQGTFGKRMIGLRVVDEAGQRISFARANGRFWSKQLSALTLGIGYVVCAFTQRKQALHDLISGCYVVSTRR